MSEVVRRGEEEEEEEEEEGEVLLEVRMGISNMPHSVV